MKQLSLKGRENINNLALVKKNYVITISPEKPKIVYEKQLPIVNQQGRDYIKKRLNKIIEQNGEDVAKDLTEEILNIYRAYLRVSETVFKEPELEYPQNKPKMFKFGEEKISTNKIANEVQDIAEKKYDIDKKELPKKLIKDILKDDVKVKKSSVLNPIFKYGTFTAFVTLAGIIAVVLGQKKSSHCKGPGCELIPNYKNKFYWRKSFFDLEKYLVHKNPEYRRFKKPADQSLFSRTIENEVPPYQYRYQSYQFPDLVVDPLDEIEITDKEYNQFNYNKLNKLSYEYPNTDHFEPVLELPMYHKPFVIDEYPSDDSGDILKFVDDDGKQVSRIEDDDDSDEELGYNLNEELGYNLNEERGYNLNEELGYNLYEDTDDDIEEELGYNLYEDTDDDIEEELGETL